MASRITGRHKQRENTRHKEFCYNLGHKCWICQNLFKLERKLYKVTEGPFPIIKVNDNGTVYINCRDYLETVHIRRLKPRRELGTNDNDNDEQG